MFEPDRRGAAPWPGQALRSGAPSLVRRFFGDFLAAARKSLACRGETRRGAANAAKHPQDQAGPTSNTVTVNYTDTSFTAFGQLVTLTDITCPVLAVFGEQEEFAVIPPADMLAILRRKTSSRDFDDWLIPGADHGFHGAEAELALAVCQWGREIVRCG